MNTYFTSALCPKCGKQLKTSDVKGYAFVCEECDENFYTVEVRQNLADLYEINVSMLTSDFKNLKPKLLELAEKYKCDFLEYDDYCNLANFGWEKGFPDSNRLNQFVDELDAITINISSTKLIKEEIRKFLDEIYIESSTLTENFGEEILKELTEVFEENGYDITKEAVIEQMLWCYMSKMQ